MGKIGQGILGGLSGKVSNAIGASCNTWKPREWYSRTADILDQLSTIAAKSMVISPLVLSSYIFLEWILL